MKLEVIKKRSIYLAISGILFIFSVIVIIFWNLNLGIDMTWWTSSEYSYTKIDINKVKKEISVEAKKIKYKNKEVINSTSVYKITGQNSLAVVIGFNSSIDSKKLAKLKENFRVKTLEILQKNDKTVKESSYTNIWKSFWDYIKNTAFITLILAIIWITLYVAWTFSWVVSWISSISFAVIVIITLFHDVVISSWLYIFISNYFPEFKIDTFFITALLTILGYSINDTIVIFDRIRANLQEWARKNQKLDEVINKSINETFRRSVFTSLTLLFVLITTFFYGPESISGFILVMIFGTIVGTYSSIFVASPLLYQMNKNKKLEIIKKKVYNPDDKIVV